MEYYGGIRFKKKDYLKLTNLDKLNISLGQRGDLDFLTFVLTSVEFEIKKVTVDLDDNEFLVEIFIDEGSVFRKYCFTKNDPNDLINILCVLRIINLYHNTNEVHVSDIQDKLLKGVVIHTVEEKTIYRDYYHCGTYKEYRKGLQRINQVSYIMYDEATEYYKLGISKDPKYREKTLRSDKPTVILLHTFTKNYEKQMHNMFADKRVRGEWFSLTNEDVINLKQMFK